jgi:hypothetical protein
MPLLSNRGVPEVAARSGLPVGLVLAAELLTWALIAGGAPHNAALAVSTVFRDVVLRR